MDKDRQVAGNRSARLPEKRQRHDAARPERATGQVAARQLNPLTKQRPSGCGWTGRRGLRRGRTVHHQPQAADPAVAGGIGVPVQPALYPALGIALGRVTKEREKGARIRPDRLQALDHRIGTGRGRVGQRIDGNAGQLLGIE